MAREMPVFFTLFLPALLALVGAFPLGRLLRKALLASSPVVRAAPLLALFLITAVAIETHATWLVRFASSYGYNHPDQPLGMYPALARFRNWTTALEVGGATLTLALIWKRPWWSMFGLMAMLLGYGVLFLWLRGSKPLLPIDTLGFFYLMGSIAILVIFGIGYSCRPNLKSSE